MQVGFIRLSSLPDVGMQISKYVNWQDLVVQYLLIAKDTLVSEIPPWRP
jgi:hypothetical protein